jgi:hypothetical protein
MRSSRAVVSSMLLCWASLQGCTLLLDTGALGGGPARDEGDAGTPGAATAGSTAVAGTSAGSAMGGASAGAATLGGSGGAGAGGASVGSPAGSGGTSDAGGTSDQGGTVAGGLGGATEAGAGGATNACPDAAVERCDGLDNDCDPSTDDVCPKGCVGTARLGVGYMQCGSIVTFANAEEACQAQGMHLVKIDSAAENELVLELTKDVGPYVWIGAKSEQTGVFDWLDGSPLYDDGNVAGVYESFGPDEPGITATRRCLQLEQPSGRWSSTACTDTQELVCETY